MSFSLRILVPGIIAVLILTGGLAFVLAISYFSYQNALEAIVKERSADLKVIKDTLYSDVFYYNKLTFRPEIKRVFIKKMATTPEIVFLRVIQPQTGKVLDSSNEEEIDQIFEQLPPFPLEPFIGQGKWQGEKILEISMQGAATENLWMGVSLKPIQKAVLKIAFQAGLLVFLFTIIFGTIFYLVFQKIILSPLMLIFQGIEKIRKGNLEARVNLKSKTELGELATAFNEMVRELRESQVALEETKAALEIKVEARTRELRELAEGLEKEVKLKTKEIREERDRIRSIIINFTDGLLVFDKENKLYLINKQAENFFGLKSQDIIGRYILELGTFPTIEPLVKLIGKEIKGVFRKEILIKKLVLEVSTIPLIIGEEKLGTLVILHDVTREKMVERMKTEFVSLSAHQLRTPLSAIKWTLRMLLDGDLGAITEEQREFIQKTYISNERMIALINDLLNVTRIEEGRFLYKPILTDLESAVQSMVNFYKEEAEKRKLKLKFQKPKKKLPQVMIDVEKIRIAIQNLLDNSIRYTQPGGKVLVSLKLRKKEIEFSVKDTGVGIPKDQQERIFTKFFRGTNALKMETEGSGLGLFITKNIIEAHGGRIWFESEEGKGTTFYFTIPIKG